MTSEVLKIRAKKLRSALETMLQVPVTHSQALELVAKEENFPTWDAACASYKSPGTTHTASNFATEASPTSIRQMLSLSNSRGALIVIHGTTGAGKSTFARAIVSDLLEQANANKPMAVLHVGFQEFSYPSAIVARFVPSTQSITRSGQPTEALVVVDELRDPHTAFEVIAMVLAGFKIIVTLHGSSSIQPIRAFLQTQSVGERLLDQLLANGQILAINADDLLREKGLETANHSTRTVPVETSKALPQRVISLEETYEIPLPAPRQSETDLPAVTEGILRFSPERVVVGQLSNEQAEELLGLTKAPTDKPE